MRGSRASRVTRGVSKPAGSILANFKPISRSRPFRRDDKRAVAHVAIEQATGSDRGDAIVSAMIEYLRERRILLPAAVTLEKIALAARALARKARVQEPRRRPVARNDRGIGGVARRRR